MEEAAQPKKRKIIGIIVLVLILVVIGSVIGYIRYRATHIITDDAFIDGDIFTVTPRIPGEVEEVLVRDDERVEKGQILVRLDTADIEARLDAAVKNLEVVKSRTAAQYAELAVLDARLKQLEARKNLLEKEKGRIGRLYEKGTVSQDKYDKISAEWEVLLAQIEEAKERKLQIKASIGAKNEQGKEPAIALAEAEIDALELNLRHSVIRAPTSGFVTRKNVNVGQSVAPGQPLMSVVPLDDFWIEANYKETDLTRVRPGQPVVFEVDTYPGVEFKGEVESIMAGTGAVFSLLPSENATGNYVKVVQRIPVRIKILDVDLDKYPLRIGMSVVPTILVEGS